MPQHDPALPARQAAFRKLMGRFATGVCVVSIVHDDGAISGMTVNSFVSVSLDPMLVCWSLQNSSSLYDTYAGVGRFAFSILADSQQALARRYAARGNSALVPEDFEPGPDGLPVIRGALAHIACRRFAAHEAGDHTLILGEVEAMAQGSSDERPLVFFGGRFAGLRD